MYCTLITGRCEGSNRGFGHPVANIYRQGLVGGEQLSGGHAAARQVEDLRGPRQQFRVQPGAGRAEPEDFPENRIGTPGPIKSATRPSCG